MPARSNDFAVEEDLSKCEPWFAPKFIEVSKAEENRGTSNQILICHRMLCVCRLIGFDD